MRDYSKTAQVKLTRRKFNLMLGAMPCFGTASIANPSFAQVLANDSTFDLNLNRNLSVLRSISQPAPKGISYTAQQKRKLTTLAYIANLSKTGDLSDEEMTARVKVIEDYIQGNPYAIDDSTTLNGLSVLASGELSQESQKRVGDALDLIGGGIELGGALLTTVSPLGWAVIAAGYLYSNFDTLTPNKVYSDRQILNSINLFANERAFEIRDANSAAKTAIDSAIVGDTFGIKFGEDFQSGVNSLPEDLRKPVEEIHEKIKSGVSLSQGERDNIKELIEKTVSAQYAKWNNSFREEVRSVIREENAIIAEKRRIQERSRRELEGAVYLTSFLATELFGSRVGSDVAKIGGAALKAANLYAAFAMGALGPIGVAAGAVQIFSSLFGRKKKDGTLKALKQISKTLQTIRKEMHQRFDTVIENQVKIYEKLDLILAEIQSQATSNYLKLSADLSSISSQIDFLQNFTESASRATRLEDFELKKINASTELADKRPDSNTLQRALDFFYNYSKVVSKSPGFISSPISTWDSKQIISRLNGAQRPDQSLSLLNLTTSADVSNEILNPLEWARGASAFAEIAALAPKVVNDSIFENLEDLRVGKIELERALDTFTSEATFIELLEAYTNAVAKISDNITRKYLVFMRRNNARERAIRHPASQAHPRFHPGPAMKVISSFEKVRRFSDFPSNAFSRLLVLSKETNQDDHYGDFELFEGDLLDYAVRNGFIKMTLMAKKSRDVSIGKKARIGWNIYEKAKENIFSYQIEILKGKNKGAKFGKGLNGLRLSKVSVFYPYKSTFATEVAYVPNAAHGSFLGRKINTTQDLLNKIVEEIIEFNDDIYTRWNQHLNEYISSDGVLDDVIASAGMLRYVASVRLWLVSGDTLGASALLQDKNFGYGSKATITKLVESISSDEFVNDIPFEVTYEGAPYARTTRYQSLSEYLGSHLKSKTEGEFLKLQEQVYARDKNGEEIFSVHLPALKVAELKLIGAIKYVQEFQKI